MLPQFKPVYAFVKVCSAAAAAVIFILIAAEPMLEKLDRIKVKYGLVALLAGLRHYIMERYFISSSVNCKMSGAIFSRSFFSVLL